MQVELVNAEPRVYRIKVPFENVITTETNCYVIVDGDDALVVDTGAPTVEGERLLASALRELGIDPARACYFLTHAHYDHAGLVPRIAGSEATIYLGEQEASSVQSDYAMRSLRHACRRFQEEGVPHDMACSDTYAVQVSTVLEDVPFRLVTLKDGAVLTVGRHRFEAVGLPGHTQGHLALFHRASGLCFSGDHVLFMLSPSVPLFADGGDSLAAYLASLDKLAALRPARLLVSHGDKAGDCLERIETLKRHHLKREDEIARIVEDALRAGSAGGGTLPTGCDIIRRIRWRIPFATVDACDPLQRWSIYGQGTVLLDHMVGEGRLVRVRDEFARGKDMPSCCKKGHPRPTFVNRYRLG